MATITLATTTFAAAVGEADTQVLLSSTSGILPGVRLYVGRELLGVERLTGIGNYAAVRRGLEGTRTRKHATSDTVYIGTGDQFFMADPEGTPAMVPYVSPHINVLNGTVWVVQGDQVGAGAAAQSWQQVTSAQSAGDLGVRVTTVTTPS